MDVRDADLSDKQLRDDLMTMLIAGHETTAAVLTWTLFALMSNLDVEAKMLDEIDSVLGDKTPGMLRISYIGQMRIYLYQHGNLHAKHVAFLKHMVCWACTQSDRTYHELASLIPKEFLSVTRSYWWFG